MEHLAHHLGKRASLSSYVLGFILSIVFTLLAFLAVTHHQSSPRLVIISIIVLAVAQLFVQLRYFLHFGKEAKPHENLWAFVVTALFVFIVVAGSLWIMHNLNYNMMSDPDSMKLMEDTMSLQHQHGGF